MDVYEADVRPALNTSGLLDSKDGTFIKWMHRFGEHMTGVALTEQLGSEEGTYE
jgi:hypothetical protein